MKLDQNPFFRKAIIPWHDSTLSCWIFIVICLFTLIFAVIGINVACANQEYAGFVWLPALMALLSLFILIKILIKLIMRRQNF